MIIDLHKMGISTPKGYHIFSGNHFIPSGFGLPREIFYNPAIPSGLKTVQHQD